MAAIGGISAVAVEAHSRLQMKVLPAMIKKPISNIE